MNITFRFVVRYPILQGHVIGEGELTQDMSRFNFDDIKEVIASYPVFDSFNIKQVLGQMGISYNPDKLEIELHSASQENIMTL